MAGVLGSNEIWGTVAPECIRQNSEFIGYGSNSDYIMAGVLLCLIAATSWLCCTVLCNTLRTALSREVLVEDSRYRELSEVGSHRQNQIPTSMLQVSNTSEEVSTLENSLNLEHPLLQGEHDTVDNSRLPDNRRLATEEDEEVYSGWKFIPRVKELRTPACIRGAHCCTRWLCGIFVTLILGATLILVLLSPKAPLFSVCASKTQWSQILNELVHFHLEADIDIVISIYNPNHVDLSMMEMVGQFKYKGDEIATFAYIPENTTHAFEVEAGSINDLEFVAKFSPYFTQAAEMLKDYEMGTLELSVVADVRVSIDASHLKIYEVHYHLPEYSFTMNDLETEYCKVCNQSP